MKNKIISFLKMEFLIKEDSLKNWRMILFFSTLAMVMISSGHYADNKIFKIASLSEKIKSLKSEFIEQRTYLMKLKMETIYQKVDLPFQPADETGFLEPKTEQIQKL